MKIGIVGGTGRLGRAIGPRLARGGAEVLIVGRDEPKTKQVAAELADLWETSGLIGGAVEDLTDCDSVILAIPAEALLGSAELLEILDDTTVISPINRVGFANGEAVGLYKQHPQAAAEQIHDLAPRLHIATAFNHLPANVAADPLAPLNADVAIAASSEKAFVDTARVVELIEGLRPLRVGSLALAREVEAFTAILINVNRTFNRNASVCLMSQTRQ